MPCRYTIEQMVVIGLIAKSTLIISANGCTKKMVAAKKSFFYSQLRTPVGDAFSTPQITAQQQYWQTSKHNLGCHACSNLMYRCVNNGCAEIIVTDADEYRRNMHDLPAPAPPETTLKVSSPSCLGSATVKANSACCGYLPQTSWRRIATLTSRTLK